MFHLCYVEQDQQIVQASINSASPPVDGMVIHKENHRQTIGTPLENYGKMVV